MRKYLNNNEFTIYTDENNIYEFISTKQIKDSIKALETLGKTDIKVYTIIDVQYELNEHISDDDYRKISSEEKYSRHGVQTEIINNNFVKYHGFKIKVNIDESYEYEGEHCTLIKSPIRKLTITFK